MGALPASARRGDDCTQLGRQRFARPRHAALGVWQGISGITASGRGGRLVLPDLADPIDLDSQRNATFAIAACSPTGVTEGLVPATAVAPTMPRDPESIRAQIERAQEQGLEFED